MIIEILTYGCRCDNCGKQWEDHNIGLASFTTIEAIEYNRMDSEWIKESNKHYCPDCYYYDDNDNLKLKEIKL